MSEPAVTGLAELQRALDQLPGQVERNILRGALRAGAKVQLEEAEHLVPVEAGGKHAGELKASLRIATSSRNGVVRAQVRAGSKGAFWARFVEFGTAAHLIRPKGAKSLFFAGVFDDQVHHPGAKKKPFMRPALDATVVRATDAVAAYIRKRLTKEGLQTPGPEG